MNKRKDMDTRSSKVVGVRFTEDEYTRLKDAAYSNRSTLSDYIRKASLQYLDNTIDDRHISSVLNNYWEGIKETIGMAEYIVVLESILKRNGIEFPQKIFGMTEDLRGFVNTCAEIGLIKKGELK